MCVCVCVSRLWKQQGELKDIQRDGFGIGHLSVENRGACYKAWYRRGAGPKHASRDSECVNDLPLGHLLGDKVDREGSVLAGV